MKSYLCLISFILCYYSGICVQPYFPEQIVFRIDQYNATFAIDQINQQAFLSYSTYQAPTTNAIAMIRIPYATPDSPQTKYMVEMTGKGPYFNSCSYSTYWAYGGNTHSEFPAHWLHGTSFMIGNYIKFRYNMIRSTNSSLDVDYWYANETCMTTFSGSVQCEEIFFRKNTDIPLRYNYMYADSGYDYQGTKYFTNVSIGKPDDKYFEIIPKDWTTICTDLNLDVLFSETSEKIDVQESAGIDIWLSTPPHRINGNDTVTIQWTVTSGCTDCLTWASKQLVFNSQNFMEKQTLTITRTKAGQGSVLTAVINGGGFVPPSKYLYNIFIQ